MKTTLITISAVLLALFTIAAASAYPQVTIVSASSVEPNVIYYDGPTSYATPLYGMQHYSTQYNQPRSYGYANVRIYDPTYGYDYDGRYDFEHDYLEGYDDGYRDGDRDKRYGYSSEYPTGTCTYRTYRTGIGNYYGSDSKYRRHYDDCDRRSEWRDQFEFRYYINGRFVYSHEPLPYPLVDQVTWQDRYDSKYYDDYNDYQHYGSYPYYGDTGY